jgi:small-conductance mechanosensitive channel/CRP-like cAMP-binding protein
MFSAGSSFLSVEQLAGLAFALLAGLILWRFRPSERRVLRNTLGLYGVGVAAQWFAVAVIARHWNEAAQVPREAAVIIAGIALIRLGGLLLFRLLLPAAGVRSPRLVEDLSVIAAYVVFGMTRLHYAGLELSGIVTTSALITAIVAFAMQDTLGNILGGLALELDSSFALGDWIRIDDVVGRVTDLGWRSISIETRNGETVVVPNGQVVRGRITLLGKRQGEPLLWRRTVHFSVVARVRPGAVIEPVVAALAQAKIDGVAHQPAADCVTLSFDNGSTMYAVRYWLTDLARDDPTDSTVREHIYAALQRQGLELATPVQHMFLHRSGDAEHQRDVAGEQAQRASMLRRSELFAGLTAAEIDRLASRLVFAPFAAGDLITRQGASAHWLYILARGSVAVLLETGNDEQRELAQLDAPAFFGEMGLMTGEPRSATVIARGDVTCYRLDKEGFAEALRLRPGIAEHLSDVLAARQVELLAARRAWEASEREARLRDQSSAILEKIRRFFGLDDEAPAPRSAERAQ